MVVYSKLPVPSKWRVVVYMISLSHTIARSTDPSAVQTKHEHRCERYKLLTKPADQTILSTPN